MENQMLQFATFNNLPESAGLFPSIVSKAFTALANRRSMDVTKVILY